MGVAKCTNFIPLKNKCIVYNVLYIIFPTESRNSSVIFNGSFDEEFLYTRFYRNYKSSLIINDCVCYPLSQETCFRYFQVINTLFKAPLCRELFTSRSLVKPTLKSAATHEMCFTYLRIYRKYIL